jgi:hypothetical protein
VSTVLSQKELTDYYSKYKLKPAKNFSFFKLSKNFGDYKLDENKQPEIEIIPKNETNIFIIRISDTHYVSH